MLIPTGHYMISIIVALTAAFLIQPELEGCGHLKAC